MDDYQIAAIFFVAWMAAWVSIGYVRKKRRRRKTMESPPERTLLFTLIRINPSSISGTVRISAEVAERYEISSGIEARMFTPANDRLLPRKGYGEKRAIPVMISADDSLVGSELAVSMEDAGTMRLDRGGMVLLKFRMLNPPEAVRVNAYRGKVPVIGIRNPRIIVQPKGPHKIRIPSRSGVDLDNSRKIE